MDNLLGNPIVVAVPRVAFDHMPLMLESGIVKKRHHHPFRFFNSLLEDPSCPGSRRSGGIRMDWWTKFKNLKVELQRW